MLADRLRRVLWTWLGPPPIPKVPPPPVGIAADGLSLHLEPPECPVCYEEAETLRLRQEAYLCQVPEHLREAIILPRFCTDCGQEIAWSHDKKANGFQSQSANHGHLKQNEFGSWMKSKAYRELCMDCYRLDWKRVYDEEPCPV